MQSSYTIRKKIEIEGVVPYTGVHGIIRLKPADKLIFRNEQGTAEVRPENMGKNGITHTTLLKEGRVKIYSVEHLLSAFVGMGIDGCEVEIEGNQLPSPDACAETFCERIGEVGRKRIGVRKYRYLTESLFRDGASMAIIRPSNQYILSALIQYPGIIGEQYYRIGLEDYAEISRSCTFFREEMTKERWSKHRKLFPWLGKVEDSPILARNKKGWLTPVTYQNEPVRHKLLDAIGDLAFLGPVKGEVTLIRPGHEFNRKLVRYLVR